MNLFDLSPNSYCILYRLAHNQSIDFKHSSNDMDELIAKEFIDEFGIVKESVSKLFTSDYEELWQEFIELYPKKVGIRRLHDKIDKNKQKYISYLKSGEKHSEILKGLKNEIKTREDAIFTGEFIPAWKNLSTYINNKSWVEYIDIEDSEEFNENYDKI
jgi:hypothetical protein